MKLFVVKLLRWVFVFQCILATLAICPANSGEIGKTLNTLILSDEAPGNLISVLIKAEYGNYNLYQTLLQIQVDAKPSISGMITPTFLSALASCPAGSQILTTKLNSFPAGSSLAISTDGTVQTVNVHATDYYNKQGVSALLSSISGVGDVYFVHSGPQPSTALDMPLTSWTVGDTTYNVFAIASGSVSAPPAPPTPERKASLLF
ncbi:MAG: hypothetical protein HY881_12835 [Deltaproteobacteria bacterium]|nr:hypothetical protein [Deltaproteobacteria bacterium]